MMRRAAALLLLLSTVCLALGQNPVFNRRERLPEFDLYHYLDFNDATAAPRLMVEVRIANDELQFVKGEQGGYQAEAEVTVELFQGKEQISRAHGWQMVRRQVNDFNETHDREPLLSVTAPLEVPAGEYRLWVRLHDGITKRSFVVEESILVPDMATYGLFLGKPRLQLLVADSLSGKISWYNPEPPDRALIEDRTGLALRLWSQLEQQVDLQLRISRDEELLVQFDSSAVVEAGVSSHWMFALPELPGSGRYRVSCTLTPPEGEEIRSESSFRLLLEGESTPIEDIDEAIEQLRYIASSKTMKRIRGALPHKREILFNEFWKELDPTPRTAENELKYEYYRRIEITDRNFGAGITPGWRTDRGRIYILHGPPDSIEKHRYESGNPPYEIWLYYEKELQFVFVDRHGFGDFRLTGYNW